MIKLLLGILLLCFTSPVISSDDDVFDLAAKYNATKKGLSKLELKKRRVLAEIYSIEKKTNKLVLQKTELDEDKMNLDAKLSNISKRVIEIERQIQTLIPDLVERLSFADQINGLPWLYTFLTAQSLNELDTTFETAKFINQQQSEKVVEFIGLMKELEEKKKKLNVTALKIVNLRKDLLKKKKDIESNQTHKNKFLKNLERRLTSEKINLKKIKGKGEKALKDSFFSDLHILFGSRFFDQKGKLPHPVDGPVTHGYGLNKGLLPDRIQLVHKGYFYGSATDQFVKSISDGRVRYVGPAQGYGQIVVIDHGSRYYSTYANLQKTNVKVNQEVNQGDPIGVTGFGHIQFGTGLYFEIRHFSQPQNPEDWLKKPAKHLANL